MPKAKQQRRNRLEVDQRKEELLKLGRRLFGRYNYEELSISDIADKAGVSKGLLYYYFPTKRDFYIETVRAAAEDLLVIIEGDDALAPLEKLRVGIEAYLKYVEENSGAYISLLQSGIGVDAAVAKIVEEVREAVVSRILDGVGVARPTPAQRIVLRGWVGFVEGSSTEWLKSRAIVRAELQSVLERQLIVALSDPSFGTTTLRGALSRVKLAFSAAGGRG